MIRLKAVKIDYPENFGIEKAQREEIMSKVVLFAFQIYHTFDRGEFDRGEFAIKIVWRITVREVGSNFIDDPSSNPS